MNDLRKERLSNEFGPEYYAVGFGPLPYERSPHWLNFFSIVADEIIRALHPRRVLDAGCAMGFLVEAFWDRAVYCEGFDLSEFAISQVRRDLRSHCRVASIITPIEGKYDLITCIEVLEHLPPDIVRAAVANLCQATDSLLFSSTPSDLEEPTHYSVHPPIYWLELFAEFGFWPDSRFDASFVTTHAMLLRKAVPPHDDFLRLFSEYIRYKTALEARSAESRDLNAKLKGLNSAWEVQRSQYEEMALAAQSDRRKTERELSNSVAERDRLLMEAERLAHRSADHDRLSEQVQTLAREKDQAQTTLQAVLGSKAWRLAEKCRVPMRKVRRDWPGVHKAIKYVKRVVTGGQQTEAVGASETSQSTGQSREARGTGLLSPVKAAPSQGLSALEDSYQRWIDEHEPTEEELQLQRNSVDFLRSPVFSIVIPVHRTDHSMLQECLESVVAQTYPRWELCVAITPDDDPTNRQFLSDLANRDRRVRVIELTENGGISHNTNAALDLSTGDFIVLLDHDDTLAPFALFEIAERLKTQRGMDLIYSDHDYLDPQHGLRCNPLFKPDWSPSIMFSANYITHLTVLRRSLLERTGRFDAATDGAQDWDLFLRAADKTARISHIPKILYHWRMHAGSTAQNDSAKNYAANAQLLALAGHMERLGMNAEPEVMPNGLLHVRFKQPPTLKVSIIIPTKDRVDLLSRCISTLLNVTDYGNFEILIADTGSQETVTQEYFDSLKDDARIRILWYPGPFNYSSVNNRAAREATGDFLLFLNNDVEITRPEWLTELVSWANLPPVGIVGGKLLRANGKIQHAGVVLGLGGFADHPFADAPALTFGMAGSTGWYRDFLAVTGACMMMRRQVFEELGGFDEAFILCGSDVEICLRANGRGYRVVYNPFAELIHHERQTRGTDIPTKDFVESLKHYRRWLLSGDPYWNANLSRWAKQPAFRSLSEQSSLDFAEKHVESVKALTASVMGTSSNPRSASDEEMLVGAFDCSEEQFQQLLKHNGNVSGFRAAKRLLWFIPTFEVPFYGGIYTILRFCEYWQREKKVEIFFAICGSANQAKIASLIRKVYPAVKDDQVFVLDGVSQAADLPNTDASICTLWTTPYYALHHKNVKRRFYLIQDFEPAFYRAGSLSALVESTYRMGLYGIANTISLKRMYEAEYGGKATYFTPSVNISVFRPTELSDGLEPKRPLQVFCYGRPKHPRNAFELVKQAMLHLKAKLGERVRIVSAGDEWLPSEYGLQGVVENLGILSYADTGRLYRESHVGVVMMLTRHPSYIPLELMASGCIAVTNINSWTSWLLKDGENCLLSPATATAIADHVERALLDVALRAKIRANALEMVRSEYLDWSKQAEKVFDYLCDPEAALEDAGEKSETSVAAAPGSS